MHSAVVECVMGFLFHRTLHPPHVDFSTFHRTNLQETYKTLSNPAEKCLKLWWHSCTYTHTHPLSFPFSWLVCTNPSLTHTKKLISIFMHSYIHPIDLNHFKLCLVRHERYFLTRFVVVVVAAAVFVAKYFFISCCFCCTGYFLVFLHNWFSFAFTENS